VQNLTFNSFVKSLHDLNERGISYIVSYDGRTGSKVHGERLPDSLGLQRIELDAGRSSQSTLLGADSRTYESLYLSPALVMRKARELSGELL
jgi:DNA adenine methylase